MVPTFIHSTPQQELRQAGHCISSVWEHVETVRNAALASIHQCSARVPEQRRGKCVVGIPSLDIRDTYGTDRKSPVQSQPV